MLQSEIEKSLEVLNKGGLILYPTDTVWGIGCDATNPEAVKKVYDLKQREDSKALICLVSDTRMLAKYIYEVPEVAYQLLDASDKPTTIIYDNPINVAGNLVASDNTLAIRVASDEFCQRMVRQFKRPLVSTSANISGYPTPQSFSEINQEILKGVDYVVNLHRDKKCNKPSTIIKIGNDGVFKIIRK
ncbi:L-threonylcarbamoyladenylate synthase [Zhouia amylolytica]|uniref:L-threonylcarbamoyladenylate synthase n=2 Tax=Zhouia amylolytica TaxID=376730 RepID=W2UQ26_9FLAO|nr:L-threonylcarbamoyladenylate synthase [Zhouia amylolytica]ETN96059.1 sua5/YciO/YrdC/YwlC family protein [Zhouia amylolytica AD3]MCQ0111345.1 threonylcarbamoyl-AMP synthase [Zhouia amylolytica]SFS50063.1 L-threonylcarbamoyladenylate synthase [Zhouia amylolytica]